ncbi:aspartate aminotransferase family protein [Oceanibacterium hippocampi]|uniref:Adenosylmethionine-8-amino-7-oxononanoate aminotransferase n=1 Tax=Oceanibacterium hippocampi TaxID=745714 RepID=A0A1Y5S4L5_9PROT|nr:aspartate aminotransferase family protein [Oceanibacterium hippocampi]SLN29659.1 Adenosylmethionine-8-amino-7-oxononanoate aminotransferase [Oceanibacterium hippocampi]
MSNVFHRSCHGSLPVAVGGEGVYLIDSTGKRYLDGSGGAAVSCLGHGHPAVIEAIQKQVGSLAFAHTGFFTNEPAEELATFLADRSPGTLNHVYFISGGSEAAEASLKLARQYMLEIGQPKRCRFIARRQSYHGNTVGALSVGGNMARRVPYAEMLIDVAHVSPCYPYRDQGPGESDADYVARLAAELDAEIERLGPETVLAFVAEPVVGATAGAVAPVLGYFKAIREVCDRHGVLLILDEVMCGMGRTGTLFACEQDDVIPDILYTAKGLGAGYQPIGAMFASEKIYGAIRDGSGFFQHGHTYMAHAAACAGALAVQKVIEGDGLIENVRRQGDTLDAALHERFGNHQHVGDIRGRGLFRAIELVADRASKATFDPSARLATRIRARAMDEGLVCYPGSGTIDGRNGDHVLIAPPFIIRETEVAELVDKLGRAVDGALADAAA